MNLWYRKYQWKIVAVTLLFVACFFSIYVIWPNVRQVIDSHTHLKEQQKKATWATNWEYKLNKFQKQQGKLEQFISTLLVSLPDKDQTSSIIDLIVDHSKDTGLTIETIRMLKKEISDNYTAIPIILEANGTYHETGIFINKLEQSNYLIHLENIRITASDEIPVKDLTASIELKVIFLKQDKRG